MPITQFLILKIPTVILGLIIVGGLIGLSVLGLLIVRRFLPHHTRLKEHHDVAGPFLGVLGAVYAVLLAFVVVTVWQGFDRTTANVEQEANCLAGIDRDAGAFAPEFGQKVVRLAREYQQAVVTQEWKTMMEGKMSPEADAIMDRIWSLYINYEPRTPKEQAFFNESVRQLNLFRQLRQQRIIDSQTGLHPLLWVVLMVGMFTTVSITFLFGMENLKVHVMMLVLLSLAIALILLTIMLLDFPFTGDISISAEPFRQLVLN